MDGHGQDLAAVVMALTASGRASSVAVSALFASSRAPVAASRACTATAYAFCFAQTSAARFSISEGARKTYSVFVEADFLSVAIIVILVIVIDRTVDRIVSRLHLASFSRTG